MEKKFNVWRLRNDLRNYYGSAMLSGIPSLAAEVEALDKAGEEEVLKKAREEGFDLGKYVIEEK